MEQSSWIEYHPLTTVADGWPIEFDVDASGEDYIDFANTMLYVKAKITRADGTNVAADSPIGPSNLFLHSLFSQQHSDHRSWSHAVATRSRWRRGQRFKGKGGVGGARKYDRQLLTALCGG